MYFFRKLSVFNFLHKFLEKHISTLNIFFHPFSLDKKNPNQFRNFYNSIFFEDGAFWTERKNERKNVMKSKNCSKFPSFFALRKKYYWNLLAVKYLDFQKMSFNPSTNLLEVKNLPRRKIDQKKVSAPQILNIIKN